MAGRPPKPLDQSTFAGQVAHLIRSARSSLSLTVDQAAARCAPPVPPTRWYAWENGLGALPNLDVIARALNLPPRQLIPDENPTAVRRTKPNR